MFPFEGKFSQTMIKGYFRPALFHMAGFATVFPHKFIDLALMRVGMADQALEGIELKVVALNHGRPVGNDMTGDTGHGEVRPLERIVGGIMLCQEEIGGGESIDGMAFFAGSPGGPMRKLTIVVIGMAVKTGGKL